MKWILLSLLLSSPLLSDIIPPERRINWSPGIPGDFPDKTFVVNVLDYSATGDGQTDDSNAFINAIRAIPASGGLLVVPGGTYVLKKTLSVNKGVLFKGEGHDKTRLLFDLSGRSDNCIDIVKYERGDWVDALEGYEKGSNTVFVRQPEKFRAGDFIEIQQENDPDIMYTQADWQQSWSETAVGQICLIDSIRADGALVLHRPLYFTYRDVLQPRLRTLGLIEYPGLEDLTIERLDAGDGYTIQMRYVAYGRVQRIESNMTYRTHVYMSECYGCEVRNNYIHHAHDYGGGGHGYGVDTIRHTSDCLIIDNVFRYLRHSMMTHVGTSGNVFAYNYSTEREPQRLCDISLHGHFSNANLFESNVVEEIDISDYWGPIGPNNTFLRNVITQEGIDINDSSHGQNLVANVLNRGTIKVHSSVKETLRHGNVLNGTAEWDPAISDREVPVSYFLTEKPDFLADSPWPLFGPDVTEGGKLPAQIRYESGRPITAIHEQSLHRPIDYNLSIYPNPFNPQTTISFALADDEQVRIDIFSISGQWVATIVDQILPAGSHTVHYHPTGDCASGIYVVRLRSESSEMSHRMTILK
ncbi:T9SS C-terminal target domain-containing protein [candidate division KSB1 bacterium]|nr:T9SS type A sorting domain-containing protein [candidate division KSB1 bacterium]RQW00323.1 MAG: T9SS C-terminal target domain-containing protein [candidate division KSB1 bacterium]